MYRYKKTSIFSNIIILILVKMLAFVNFLFISEMMAMDMSVVTDVVTVFGAEKAENQQSITRK